MWRVAGILATSRALGDFPLKEPRKLVTAEPDVLTFSLRDHKVSTKDMTLPFFFFFSSILPVALFFDLAFHWYLHISISSFSNNYHTLLLLFQAHFVILATDGLWDVFSNEEAVAYIRDHIHESDFGAKSLCMSAYYRGSQDNITVAILNIDKLGLWMMYSFFLIISVVQKN